MSQNEFINFRKFLLCFIFLYVYFTNNAQRFYNILAHQNPNSMSFLPAAIAISPDEIKKKEEDIRAIMFTISRQLGVTCTTCHETENFRENKKSEFKVALEHMKITQTLIDKGFDGKKGPKADCYMCHRGQLKPSYKEPQNPMRE